MKVIIVMGPTGAGKTALGIALAKEFNGEIVNADSRQIYVGMDVGTDKVGSRRMPNDRMTNDERRALRREPVVADGVRHYLMDILTPDQQYSAAQFRDDARTVIADIHRRQKLPIVVGGTGFYIRTLTGERELPNVPPDTAFRAWAERQPVEALAAELRRRALEMYAKVDNPGNRRRVTRYLEVARAKQKKVSGTFFHDEQKRFLTPFFKLALVPPRDDLLERLAARVDAMLQRGFVDEVKTLVRQYGERAPGLQSTGYRQVLRHLHGELGEEELRTAIVRDHWNTARRQLAWLRREPHACVVATAETARAAVRAFIPAK